LADSSDKTRRQHRLYGRHKGHQLKPHQARLVEQLLPQLRIDLDDLKACGPAGLFAHAPADIWLEIGFGGGEHLAWQAKANPDVGFIGCEPFLNGVAKLLSAIEADTLRNVRIHDHDARDLIECLGDETISRVFLLYPDPWPKTRHHKRRFVNPWSLGQLHRVMKPGSELRIASDIADYITWTLVEMRRFGKFAWLAETPDDWRARSPGWPQTRYEQKALRAGRVPVYLTFRRMP
jgi:tRNA (guanine-N7-)-methyltransferase